MTGASGAGKTFLAQRLEKELEQQCIYVAYFDSIGVPSVDEMIEKYGSCERWQEAMTHKWVCTLALKKDKPIVLLERQFNPQFIIDACKKNSINNLVLFVVHVEKNIREERLVELRMQPE
jgi:broad-specificity NMP kinase